MEPETGVQGTVSPWGRGGVSRNSYPGGTPETPGELGRGRAPCIAKRIRMFCPESQPPFAAESTRTHPLDDLLERRRRRVDKPPERPATGTQGFVTKGLVHRPPADHRGRSLDHGDRARLKKALQIAWIEPASCKMWTFAAGLLDISFIPHFPSEPDTLCHMNAILL